MLFYSLIWQIEKASKERLSYRWGEVRWSREHFTQQIGHVMEHLVGIMQQDIHTIYTQIAAWRTRATCENGKEE